MLNSLVLAVVATAAIAAPARAAETIVKASVESGGRARAYYLFVPDTVQAGKPAPLLVLLHGSRQNGRSLVERWRGVASKEGIILAGPDSLNSMAWNLGADAPNLLYDVVQAVSAAHPVNPRRVYLFGHSAGAVMGLMMAALESQYFAAVAVHAGALPPDDYALADRMVRPIPVGIWVGTSDPLFPVPQVHATRDALRARKMPVQVTEIKGHTHDYYGRARAINPEVWAFLRQHALDADPVFVRYDIR